jgi:hypothetical protein
MDKAKIDELMGSTSLPVAALSNKKRFAEVRSNSGRPAGGQGGCRPSSVSSGSSSSPCLRHWSSRCFLETRRPDNVTKR